MTHFNAHSLGTSTYPKGLYSSQALSDSKLSSKALGTDPTLSRWVEENQYIFNQIQNGTSDLSPMDASQFMDWWNWAQSSLSGSGWDAGGIDVVNPNSDPGMGALPAQADPFGGMPGTMGNLVYNGEKETVGFTGNATRDFWSNDVTLQVAPLSAEIVAERTTDTRFNPPEDVIRVTITDSATGTSTVNYIHIDDPANPPNITVECVNASQFTDNTGGAVTQKKFKAHADGNAVSESSVEAIEENGQLVYEGRAGEVIQFNPKGGEDQEHMVWGSADITVGTRDRVAVYQSEMNDPSSPDAPIPATKVVVTHSDGSTDTYYQPQDMDFTLNLNATESRVIWGSHPAGTTDGVPADFADLITLNTAPGADAEDEVEVAGDQPSSVDGNQRTFNQNANAELYTRKDGGSSQVFARGDVTLHASSNQEYWVATWDSENNCYVIQVYADASKADLKETITVDGMADHLKLDIDPNQLEFAGSLMEDLNPHGLSGTAEAEKVSLVGADGQNIQTSSEQLWPDADTLNAQVGSEATLNLMNAIREAVASGDWSAVVTTLNGLNGESGNDLMRSLLTQLYNLSGQDQEKFDAALDQMPAYVRQKMSDIAYATWTERSEQASGDQWNSWQAASILANSIGGSATA